MVARKCLSTSRWSSRDICPDLPCFAGANRSLAAPWSSKRPPAGSRGRITWWRSIGPGSTDDLNHGRQLFLNHCCCRPARKSAAGPWRAAIVSGTAQHAMRARRPGRNSSRRRRSMSCPASRQACTHRRPIASSSGVQFPRLEDSSFMRLSYTRLANDTGRASSIIGTVIWNSAIEPGRMAKIGPGRQQSTRSRLGGSGPLPILTPAAID